MVASSPSATDAFPFSTPILFGDLVEIWPFQLEWQLPPSLGLQTCTDLAYRKSLQLPRSLLNFGVFRLHLLLEF